MKLLKQLSFIALLAIAFVSCKNEVATPNYAKAEFGIDGMTCAMGCAKTIEKKMAKMEGVKSAKVDFDKGLAMVEYDKNIVTTANLEETVAKAGDAYKVKNMKNVESFSTEKKACKSKCDMACCTGNPEKDKANCKEADKATCAKKKDKATI